MRVGFYASLSLLFFLPAVYGESSGQLIQQQANHQQEQEKARYNQLETQGKEVRASESDVQSSRLKFPAESQCFKIRQVVLNKDKKVPGWIPLQRLTRQAEDRCLGIAGVWVLVTAIQNNLISHGYITTRVVIPPQDMNQGKLTLTILTGVVGNITFTADSNRYTSLFTTFPGHKGDILDLRAIEQGLENIQRVPGADADVLLRPGSKAGETDIEVKRTQPSFWRIGGWFDDSGSKYTGRYQSGLAFYLDNPTSLNDLFYVAVGRDLAFQHWRNSKNGSVYYSVPYGYWSLDLYAGHNEYLQKISGIWADFQYQGKSDNLSLRLNRLLYRNARQKTSLGFQVLRNNSHYYLNDTEIYNQERRVTHLITRLSQRRYMGQSVVDATVSYQRNASWFGARQQAETSSKNHIVNLDVSALVPFTLFGQSMSYQPHYQQQYTPDTLATQDQFSIGNRWTVRGFDGEYNMSANKGYYLRNDINLNFPALNHQLYVGVDYGKVSGGNGYFSSGHLAGGVAGIRGAIGGVSYDAFAGIPFSRPDNFDTSPVSLGFTVQWQFASSTLSG